MDSNLDQQNWWDEQSCVEFEQFLDDIAMEEAEEIWEERRIAALEAEWERIHGNGEGF